MVIRLEDYEVQDLREFAERMYSFGELRALHREGRRFVDGGLSGKGQHYILLHEATSAEPDLVFVRKEGEIFELTDECYTLIMGRPRGNTIGSLDEGIRRLLGRIERRLAHDGAHSNQSPPHPDPS